MPITLLSSWNSDSIRFTKPLLYPSELRGQAVIFLLLLYLFGISLAKRGFHCGTPAPKLHSADRRPGVKHLTIAMPDGRVRALCARIAIEIDPEKVDALIVELRKLLLDGDYRTMEVQALAEELLRNAPHPKQQN